LVNSPTSQSPAVSGNFMTTTYIQFDAPTSNRQTKKDGLLKKIFVGILTKIIPKANPGFDDIIDDVKYWVLECDNESGIPQREIGLDKEVLYASLNEILC